MDSHGIHVMTIANSIIGVSIIAMPYCFKQCGVILSIIMLICSSIISRLSCHFLLKSAIRARLRTFEFLAYHAFGQFGKFIVEIGMIGFLLGTCIAFFVVMGDLGPQIVAQLLGYQNNYTLRSGILISLAVFCVLPLGLLRNVDSLSGVCIATIGFYICLVLKIIAESTSHIISGDWFNNMELWRTEGALQCIPIFSMALFCQTQLFEIYQAIPNASLEKMNALIRIAVNICTCVYIFVGIFGYIALSDKVFTGNILLSLTPSLLTEVIKIGFVLSLAFSFPLIIFPCRASLFSLIYKPTYTMLHDGGTHFIPETKFRMITIFIVAVSLFIGILIPNIELVLGLVGSTIGVSICVLFPATCFICMVKKNTNERILAQIMLCVGVVVMVLGTYANLNAADDIAFRQVTQHPEINVPVISKIEDRIRVNVPTTGKLVTSNIKLAKNVVRDDIIKEVRHEPPQPIEPAEQAKIVEIKKDKIDPIVPVQTEIKPELELKEIRKEPPQPIEPEQNINQIKKDESQVRQVDTDKVPEIKIPEESVNKQPQEKSAAEANPLADQVDAEAIKKEDKEINQQAQEDLKNVVQKLDYIGEMQKQNQEQQQQILEQQKMFWEEMKQKKDAVQEQIEIDKVKQEKLKAVKEIQDIAKKAIESLVDENSKILLDSKVVGNVDETPKLISLDANQTLDNSKANPAPLSYQLGLNVLSNGTNKTPLKNENSSSAFVPLPIIKSGIILSNDNITNSVKQVPIDTKTKTVGLSENKTGSASHNDANIVSKTSDKVVQRSIVEEAVDKNKKDNDKIQEIKISDKKENDKLQKIQITDKKETESIQETKFEEKKVNEKNNPAEKKDNDNDLEEIKSMRRDILADQEDSARSKRDIFNSKTQNHEVASNEDNRISIVNDLVQANENKNCDKRS